MKAIAAMSRNRVIGRGGAIPWHLPEDFRWFKKRTLGRVVVMGRKTFESLGKPLPGRTNVVISRGAPIPGVTTVSSPDALPHFEQEIFVIGGAEIYARLLPRCTDLYLTIVDREVQGDAFFPEFEPLFNEAGVVFQTDDFVVRHYVRSTDSSGGGEKRA